MTKEMSFKHMTMPVTSVNFTKDNIIACINAKGYDVPCMFRNKTMTGQKLGTLYGDVLCKNSW